MLQKDRERAGGHHEQSELSSFHEIFRPVFRESENGLVPLAELWPAGRLKRQIGWSIACHCLCTVHVPWDTEVQKRCQRK